MKLKFRIKGLHITHSYSNKNCKSYVLKDSYSKVYRLLDYQFNMQPFDKIFIELKLKKL